jgi:hypothetical protein
LPYRDSSGLTALAYALREHTGLQQIRLIDWWSFNVEAGQGTAIDPLLRALRASACPHPRTVSITTTCASASAVKRLLQLGPAADLYLVVNADLWLKVADGIRQGHCNIRHLCLDKIQRRSSTSTEAVKAIASAIRLDRNLECLTLIAINDFTDEADEVGVALAEALTVNESLRILTLSEATLGSQAYDAFSAMMRVNTSIVLKLPPFDNYR